MTIVIVKPEKLGSVQRARVNELLYCLKCDAQKSKELEQLIKERDYEIANAYRFSYGVVNLDSTEPDICYDPFYLVSEIISLKERYAKRIQRFKIRHKRFKDVLDVLPAGDAEVLMKALCTSIEVDEREVKKVIKKHFNLIKGFYKEDEEGAII